MRQFKHSGYGRKPSWHRATNRSSRHWGSQFHNIMAQYNTVQFNFNDSKDVIFAAFGLGGSPDDIPCIDRPVINERYIIMKKAVQKTVEKKNRKTGNLESIVFPYLCCKDSADREHQFSLYDIIRCMPDTSYIEGDSEDIISARTAETEKLIKARQTWLNSQNLHVLGQTTKELVYRLITCESFSCTALRIYRNRRYYSVTIVPKTKAE